MSILNKSIDENPETTHSSLTKVFIAAELIRTQDRKAEIGYARITTHIAHIKMTPSQAMHKQNGGQTWFLFRASFVTTSCWLSMTPRY